MSIQLAIVILYIILLFAISMYVKHRASQNPHRRGLATTVVAEQACNDSAVRSETEIVYC